MATITVVAPKIIQPGPGAHFRQFTEANSVSVAAKRISVTNGSGKWAAAAASPTAGTVIGQNQVAGANVTTANPTTDHFVFVEGTIIEINSNATGTDPVVGLAYNYAVSGNNHQLDQTDTTNKNLIMVSLAATATSGDTNVACWARPKSGSLYYSY